MDNKYSFVITGGGTAAIPQLLMKGGFSDRVYAVNIPYSVEEYDKAINHVHLKQYCSDIGALLLALRAHLIAHDSVNVISCTASLFSEGQRPDRINRAYICKIIEDKNVELIELTFNVKDRQAQEETLNKIIQSLFLDTAITFDRDAVDMKTRTIGEQLDFSKLSYLEDLIFGDTQSQTGPEVVQNIFSGSFNPIHSGHIEIIKNLCDTIEISFINADKQNSLDLNDLLDRVNKIRHTLFSLNLDRRITISCAPRFIDKFKEKSTLKRYIVGSDTLNRIFNKKFYSNIEWQFFLMLLNEVKKTHGIFPFTVVPRIKNGEIIQPNKEFYEYYTIAHGMVSKDISSTEVRNGEKEAF